MKKTLKHLTGLFLLILLSSCAADQLEITQTSTENSEAVWEYNGESETLQKVIEELKNSQNRKPLERRLAKNEVLWKDAKFLLIDNKKRIMVPFLSVDRENVIGVLALVKDAKGNTTFDMAVRSRLTTQDNKLPFWNPDIWMGYFMALDKDILGIKNGNPGFRQETTNNLKTKSNAKTVCDLYETITSHCSYAYTYNAATGEAYNFVDRGCTDTYSYNQHCYWVPDPIFPTTEPTIDFGGGSGGGGYITNTIVTTYLKPCMQTILTDLKSLPNGISQNIIQKFAGNIQNYNWQLNDGPLLGPTGSTDPPALYNHSTGSITTTFDSQAYLSATDLSWARTMLHESIHAYLATRFAIDRPNFIATYPTMVSEWGILQNWNAIHHQEIARSIVTDVAIALEQYGIAKGYNLNKQFYEDMAWGGLQDTSTFKALPTTDQKRILDTISIELTGSDTNGNIKSQKGYNAGC